MLRVERVGITTSDQKDKGPLCHFCRERKPGKFTMSVDGKPMCAECAEKRGKPIP